MPHELHQHRRHDPACPAVAEGTAEVVGSRVLLPGRFGIDVNYDAGLRPDHGHDLDDPNDRQVCFSCSLGVGLEDAARPLLRGSAEQEFGELRGDRQQAVLMTFLQLGRDAESSSVTEPMSQCAIRQSTPPVRSVPLEIPPLAWTASPPWRRPASAPSTLLRSHRPGRGRLPATPESPHAVPHCC